jgi:squalene-hopene/tetraprenyl-beta-curcumene cyclase
MIRVFPLFAIAAIPLLQMPSLGQSPKPLLQYDCEEIKIPAASVEEPRVSEFGKDSILAAAKYLDDGAYAWTKTRTCIACHTTGVYLAERPILTELLRTPVRLVRDEFAKSIPPSVPASNEDRGIVYYKTAERAVWRSLGLAEWDRYVERRTSDSTDKSLRDMLLQQSSHGGFHVTGEVEIPYITTDYNLSTQAMRAIVRAPMWLEQLKDPDLLERVEKLKQFLKTTQPSNDYDRMLRLQLSNLMPGLISNSEKENYIDLLSGKQRSDGGWSTRSMSDTMSWHVAVSNKVKTLIDSLPDAANPESDAYMTAFAIVLLRESGVQKEDPRVQKGIAWLKRDQRTSGRWWMHSLYRGNYHFTTYIATAQAMKALYLCDELQKHTAPN